MTSTKPRYVENLIRKDQFPYTSPFGFEYDSGDYHTALEKVLDAVDYKGLRAEQQEKRNDPNSPTLMGIGLVTFTEVVGAGPTKMCDILGLGCLIPVKSGYTQLVALIARMGTITQGQGHQTTYAQIIASELGIPSEVIQIEEGDTSTAPGLGTYGSRSTPVAGAAIAMAARKIHAKAKRSPRIFLRFLSLTSIGRSIGLKFAVMKTNLKRWQISLSRHTSSRQRG